MTTAFIDGDNQAEIVTGPGVGGRGRLKVFSFDPLTLGHIADLVVFDPVFSGGLFIATGR